MTLVAAKTTPCAIPPDFDQDAYGGIAQRMSGYSDNICFSGYAGGFNGVAFRFAAADQAHERVCEAFSVPGALSPSGPRYKQEEALFAFYVNAVSAVECLYFGLYNIGACLGSSEFRVESDNALRHIGIGSTATAYLKAYPKERLSADLQREASSRQLKSLKDYRDFFAHRGALPRKHVVKMGANRRVNLADVSSATIVGNPKELPSSWRSTFELSPSMTAPPRAWLGITVSALLRSTDRFLATQGRLS